MSTPPDISIPKQSVPLAVPIGLSSVLLLGTIAFTVYHQTYSIAITELRRHEVVDLADETRKNANGLRATLTQLREDVLTLAQYPQIRTLIDQDRMTDRSLRRDVVNAFREICQAHPPASATAGVPNWKHYMQLRLIDSSGHERVRVQRQGPGYSGFSEPQDGLMDVPFEVLDADAEIQNAGDRRYDQSDRDYFQETVSVFERVRAQIESLHVSMSRIEFNQEKNNPSSPIHNVLTIRASVPLTRTSEHGLEFRGILIIDLDLESAVRSLTNAARHQVYLSAGEADGSGKPAVLLYNPQYLEIRKPDNTQHTHDGHAGSTDTGDGMFRTFRSVLSEHIEDIEQFEQELDTIFSDQPEQTEMGANDSSVLPLEDRGARFPNDTLDGNRLRLHSDSQFRLFKLTLSHPTDPLEAADFRAKLSKKLKIHRSDAVRVTPLVRPNSNSLSIRAADNQQLMDLVRQLENVEGHPGRVTRQYDEPALCQNFAAHYFRVYFDPVRRHRYLALLAGFSDEELTAELAGSRSAAWTAFLVWTVAGGALFLIFLWWFVTRPVHQLTAAAEGIVRGEFDTRLPVNRRDEIGTLSRSFTVMVNEIRARNNEIRRQNEELDGKVQERTASLFKSRNLLEAAVSSRDAFLATISHELRTPLNHIYGYAQLLEMTELDDQQLSDLEKLKGSSRHMLRLVQDVLDYQKIIMGRLPVRPGTFDIGTLLVSVHKSNLPKAAQRGNTLELHAHDVQGNVFNDEHRLRQILDNLVGNACKFTSSGTITIDAQTAGDSISIAVTDTGIGISPEGMEKLFRPFCKVSDSELNPDGTGLGLVISRELARRMGGDLTVSSVPHEGTTFVATILRQLPSSEEEEPVFTESTSGTPTDAQPTSTSSARDAFVRHSSSQVLVIDDDPNVREVVARLLTEDGLNVMTAATGAEGIELAAQYSPSVITLDLLMPDVDGWTVLAALKNQEQTADIPVVLVTVLDDTQQGYSFGAADYVAKPIEGDRLTQIVRRYCGDRAPAVLIVDDNPQDREIVRRILRNDGCSTLEAFHGADGLKTLEDSSVDLVILDLMMPVMDGFTFVEEMRSRNMSIPPIVVLTAREMTAADRDRLSGLVSDVIQKGQFDRRRFLRQVHQHLDNHRRQT